MNPQPEPYVGNIFGLIFLGIVIYHFCKSYFNDDGSTISDNYIIGYLEDSDTPNFMCSISQTFPGSDNPPKDPPQNPDDIGPKPKIQKKQIKKNKNANEDKLLKDCIDALNALGMRKSESKKRAETIFSINRPKNIQDFLMVALRK